MMKYFLLFVFIFLGSVLPAQQVNVEKSAQKAAKELSKVYQLDQNQKQAALKANKIYYQQLNTIAALKAENNRRAYLHKLKAIRQGREMNIKKILRADQLPAFEAEQARQKKEYDEKLAALKASGASKEKLELAKIAIE